MCQWKNQLCVQHSQFACCCIGMKGPEILMQTYLWEIGWVKCTVTICFYTKVEMGFQVNDFGWVKSRIPSVGLGVRVVTLESPGKLCLALEQVANLLCAHVNSASYPLHDRKWVVPYKLWAEGLVWLIGVVVCLCAAPRVQLFVNAGNGWPHNAPQYRWLLPISCHFQDCKSASGHDFWLM